MATLEATAVNGHRMVYNITGYAEDGTPITSQWDAQHSDTCPCHTAEDTEPLPTY